MTLPQVRHVFRSPQLTINLPGGVQYTAVRTDVPGAPLRAVTVRDAIADQPAITNWHSACVALPHHHALNPFLGASV